MKKISTAAAKATKNVNHHKLMIGLDLGSGRAAQLREPLVAEGKAVADPYLPTHIQSGFEANNVSINSITPKLVRELLHTIHDIDSTFAAAPRACLSRRDWVEEFLRYSLTDHGALKGLPLALLADGKLHTFGYSKAGIVFSGSEEQRMIFRQQPQWFIDVKFEQDTGLQEERQSRFCRMGPAELIANLGAVLGKDAVSKTRDWQPDGADVPNSEWLMVLFNYLATVPRLDLQKSVTDLQRWPLIPDQHDTLHPLNDSVPIFRPDEPTYKKQHMPRHTVAQGQWFGFRTNSHDSLWHRSATEDRGGICKRRSTEVVQPGVLEHRLAGSFWGQ